MHLSIYILENVEEISSSLAALTSDPSSLGPYDVTNAARILDHVTETPGVQINTESAQNLITCVSDLLNIDEIAMLTSEKTSGSVSRFGLISKWILCIFYYEIAL